MNTATANLENDHIHILRLIDVMEQITKRQEADVAHLEMIVDLIRNFSDGLHHAKEEKLLFPKMVEKGYSFQQGPVAVMMHDHVQGRNFVKEIVDNISLYKTGNKDAVNGIYKNMQGYVDLLRAHITKENNILFRMADNVLSNEEQILLLEQFKKVESNPICGVVVADCIAQIYLLSKVYCA